MAILISDKVYFKSKNYKRQRTLYIKVSIQQEAITIINIYTSNNKSPKHMRKKWIEFKKEIESSTIIAGDFNTQLSKKDRTAR